MDELEICRIPLFHCQINQSRRIHKSNRRLEQWLFVKKHVKSGKSSLIIHFPCCSQWSISWRSERKWTRRSKRCRNPGRRFCRRWSGPDRIITWHASRSAPRRTRREMLAATAPSVQTRSVCLGPRPSPKTIPIDWIYSWWYSACSISDFPCYLSDTIYNQSTNYFVTFCFGNILTRYRSNRAYN